MQMRNIIVHKAPGSLTTQWDYRGNNIELFQRARTLCIYF